MRRLTSLVLFVVLVIAVGVLALAARSLARRTTDRRFGRLIRVDLGNPARPLFAPGAGIFGRPDEIRALPDGRPVPIELKSRQSPVGGPPRSVRLQVAAYNQILEETVGRAPPYGLVRYGDGREWVVPWDDAAREELGSLLSELRRPYDGRASPSWARCRRCPWREGCDARAA